MSRSATAVFRMSHRILRVFVAIAAATAACAQADTMFYVSPSGGDAWSGTLAAPDTAGNNAPFASITRARDTIRQLKSRSGGLREPVRVQVRGGTYHMERPLSFEPADSGPITYAAYPGERPVPPSRSPAARCLMPAACWATSTNSPARA